MEFYIGLHQPSDARHFTRCMISVNRLRDRVSDFAVGTWMMDSGAFTEISRYGHYRHEPSEYAAQIRRWSRCGQLVVAVAQDVMCEPFIAAKTGLSVLAHQAITVKRYDRLICEDVGGATILPVIQGYEPAEYVRHVHLYGPRLTPGMWVGVGSVCKRNGDPAAIEAVLLAIKQARPDLRLHGFGIKQTAMQSGIVRQLLHSADSLAWSFAARKARHHGDLTRNANDWHEADAYWSTLDAQVFNHALPMYEVSPCDPSP